MAVGIVIGLAFAAVVTAFVADLITPLIAAIFGKQDFSSLTFTINGSTFHYGDFINALIAFVLVAIALFFFVIKPVNALVARSRREGPPDPRRPQLPRVPERDPDRGDTLRVLHDGGARRRGLGFPRTRLAVHRRGAPFRTVAPRLVHQRLEEARVLACLGVPEDADREALALELERLDAAVLVVRDRPQPLAEAGVALVVVRLDGRPLAEQAARAACRARSRRRGRRSAGDSPCGPSCPTWSGRCWIRSPPSATFSTCEPRQIASTGRSRSSAAVQERELGAVALGHDPVRLGMRVLAVELGIEIGAAGEDQAVERRRASPRRPRRRAARAAPGRRPARPPARSRRGRAPSAGPRRRTSRA